MNTTNYIGRIIYDLKVLEKDEERLKSSSAAMNYWLCECLICHQISSYSSSGLAARKKSGCSRCKEVLPIGEKYNRLTIKQYLGKIKQNEARHYYLCECDCGNTTTSTLNLLKSGAKKSCGCLNKENAMRQMNKLHEKQLKDLTGMKKGLLTIERLATQEEYFNKPKERRYWFARCDCGNSHIVNTSDFLMGKVQSCGCLLSKGEMKISQILSNNNIKYIKQYSFSDLLGKNNTHYSFDFGVIDDNNKLLYLIEYDGVQHSEESKQFVEGDYEKIQERDYNKNQYCKINNIPLIRIPYTQFNNLCIKDLLLETTSFLFDFS